MPMDEGSSPRGLLANTAIAADKAAEAAHFARLDRLLIATANEDGHLNLRIRKTIKRLTAVEVAT
jgi:hypothetical protein